MFVLLKAKTKEKERIQSQSRMSSDSEKKFDNSPNWGRT